MGHMQFLSGKSILLVNKNENDLVSHWDFSVELFKGKYSWA